MILPAGTKGIAARRKQDEDRRRAERAAANDAARFAKQIQTLATRAELHRNWGDQEFREKFAPSAIQDPPPTSSMKSVRTRLHFWSGPTSCGT